jgi:hypothetical protein
MLKFIFCGVFIMLLYKNIKFKNIYVYLKINIYLIINMNYTENYLEVNLDEIYDENSIQHHKHEIKHIKLTRTKNTPIHLKNDFLHNYTNLEILEANNITNILSIGDNFLRNSKISNNTLNKTLFNSVYYIGNYFLSNCDNLIELELDLPTIDKIGNYFLHNCVNLKNIIINTNFNLISIGDTDFLSDCHNLISFDTTPLLNVDIIGDNFLRNCYNLKNLNTDGLKNIKRIHDNFCENTQLETLDTTNLKNLMFIEQNFLWNCKYLTYMDLSNLENILEIESFFLSKCSNLKQIIMFKNITKEIFSKQNENYNTLGHIIIDTHSFLCESNIENIIFVHKN